MVAHALYKPLLKEEPGLRFLDALSILQMPWSPYRIRIPNAYYYQVFEEFPLPYGQMDKAGAKQCDIMIHLNYRKGALFYKDGVQILVEIKQTRQDLLRAINDKMYFSKYLGSSDYLYLATTPELLSCAKEFIQDIPELGLFDIASGKIFKLAERQEMQESRRITNYQTMLCYYKEMPRFVNSWFPAVSIGLNRSQPFNMDDEYDNEKNKSYFKACFNARFFLCESLKAVPPESKLEQYYKYVTKYIKDYEQ